MPTAEMSSALLERVLDAYDELVWRHAHRRPPGQNDPDLIASRRQLLIARSRAQEWIAPVSAVVEVERLMARLDDLETVEEDVERLDRFPLDVLDALERRSTGRRDRDREAETIAFTFA